MFKLWSFTVTVSRRDQVLSEINETLRKVDVAEGGPTGVQILADRFRRADKFARGYERRVYELEESVKEYERVFLAMKANAVEVEPLPPVDEQPTPIEQAARRSSGVDLSPTQQQPAYSPGGLILPDTGPRPLPVFDKTALLLRSDQLRRRIVPTQAETDGKA